MSSLIYLNQNYFLIFNIGLITISVIFFVIIDIKSTLIDNLKIRKKEILRLWDIEKDNNKLAAYDEELTIINFSLKKLKVIYSRVLACFRYSLYANIFAVVLIIVLEYLEKIESLNTTVDIIKVLIILATIVSVYGIYKNTRRTKELYLFDIEEEMKKGKKDKIEREVITKNLTKLIDEPDEFRNIILHQNKKKIRFSFIRKKSIEVWNNLFK